MSSPTQMIPPDQLKLRQCIVVGEPPTATIEITNMTKVKAGKHGAARVVVTGRNLQTGQNWQGTYPAGQAVTVTEVAYRTYTVLDAAGGVLTVRSGDGSEDTIATDRLSVNSLSIGTIQEAMADGDTCTITMRTAPGFLEIGELDQTEPGT